MASVADIQKILHAYVKHTGNPRVSPVNFDTFTQKYARRFLEKQPELAPLLGDQRNTLVLKALEKLEQEKSVQLETDGVPGEDETGKASIKSIYYKGFYAAEITRWYAKMQREKNTLFPTEESLELTIPAEVMTPVPVNEQFVHYLESDKPEEHQVLLLRFPNGVNPIVTTTKLVRGPLLPLSLHITRDYLRTGSNGSYMETKLRAVFPGKEMLVREMIETAQTRPDVALQSIRQPNEFQFHFWTQISSIIIKDYAQKTEKLQMEHAYCQAAYLLGYYNVFLKGRHQDDKKKDETHKILSAALQKPPYTFTVQDVYGFTDDHGIPLTKRVGRDEVNRWLEEMLRRPNEKQISELVTVNTPEKSGIMVHSKQYVPLLLRQIKGAAPVLTQELTNEMVQAMLDERKEAWLEDAVAFEERLEEKVRDEFDLLYGLATFQTLFLVLDGQEMPEGQRQAAMSLIDPAKQKMHSWTEIFRMDRESMYRDARLHLPFWMLIPILRGIVRILRIMFGSGTSGTGTAPSSSRSGTKNTKATKGIKETEQKKSTAASQEARKKAFRETVIALQKEYLDGDETAATKLKRLREQWNPLIDPVKRDNLVEDVNSLCRDMLRRMRYSRTFQAPDAKRIDELADRIASNPTFARITRRKAFETYLKLYMLTVLQRM